MYNNLIENSSKKDVSLLDIDGSKVVAANTSEDISNNHSQKKPAPLIPLNDFTGEPAVQENFRDKFLRSRLDQTKNYPLPEALINLNQRGIAIALLTLKSFSLWQGKQKSKKTTTLVLAVAAFIKGIKESSEDNSFTSSMDGIVLFFDNEQGESYAARTMRLILKVAGVETSDRLVYSDLREFPPNDRRKIIEAGVASTPGVKLVIIDGLVDLMNDFMDPTEGHQAVTDILRLCSVYNIHVAGVLHQNKGDKNARAHVGSISSQKCEMEVSTEVDPDDRAQSLVTCVNSRGLPFEPFAIRWDKGSLPCISKDWNTVKNSDVKANKIYNHHKDIVKMVFKPLATLTNKEAIDGIMGAALKSESAAKRYLNDYLRWGMILKGLDGHYRINNQEGSRVHEGSNEGS